MHTRIRAPSVSARIIIPRREPDRFPAESHGKTSADIVGIPPEAAGVPKRGFLVWRWAPNPVLSLLQEVTGYGENEYQA